ncbi:MAG: M23 family metallopeptidase [Verrucomicrobiota bacterium]
MSPRTLPSLLLLGCLAVGDLSATEITWPTSLDRSTIRSPEDYLQPTISGKTESATFGMVREDGQRFHEGVDIKPVGRNAAGEPLDLIFSAMDGQVAYLNPNANGPYGKYVVLYHPRAEIPAYTLYAHLAKLDPGLKVNDPIARGKVIGLMGHTSAGVDAITKDRSHLHFEVGVILSKNFNTWYAAQAENRGSPNLHGLWNGQNLMGMDPMPVLQHTQANLLEVLRSQKTALTVTMRTSQKPYFVELYPMLVQGDAAHAAGWYVEFSWQGMPIRWTALDASSPKLPGNRWRLFEVDQSLRKILVQRKMLAADTKRPGELLTQNVEVLLSGVR